MDFPTTLWEWYGQDEDKRVLVICEVIPALQFLAMTPDSQREAIPYCPACEAWSETMTPLGEALSVCGSALPVEISTRLQGVWDLCNALTDAAFHCDDWWIFDHEEWQPIRVAAEELLGLMGAVELAPYLDELLLDCRNSVRGIKRRVVDTQ